MFKSGKVSNVPIFLTVKVKIRHPRQTDEADTTVAVTVRATVVRVVLEFVVLTVYPSVAVGTFVFYLVGEDILSVSEFKRTFDLRLSDFVSKVMVLILKGFAGRG